MNARRARLILAALLTAAASTTAQAGISTESPFAPRGISASGLVANSTPVELRGIVSDEQGVRFAIYDPVKKEGAWVRLDEKGQSFVVRSHDPATNRIVVDYQGKSQTIVLVEPKFGPGKAIAGAIPMPGAPQAGAGNAAQPPQGRFAPSSGSSQQGTQQQNANDARRLEAIRAEVARRRAQRESSAQQSGQSQ